MFFCDKTMVLKTLLNLGFRLMCVNVINMCKQGERMSIRACPIQKVKKPI